MERVFKRKEGGFSLMEVIIATGIVSTSFVVLMSLFAYNIRMEGINRKRIVAAYLVQEAMEIVKAQRDTNWFTSGASAWDNGIPNNNVIITGNPIVGWDLQSAGSNHRVYFDGQYYSQGGGGKDTGFTRVITKRVVGDVMQIDVDVAFNNGTTHVKATTYAYNNWNS